MVQVSNTCTLLEGLPFKKNNVDAGFELSLVV